MAQLFFTGRRPVSYQFTCRELVHDGQPDFEREIAPVRLTDAQRSLPSSPKEKGEGEGRNENDKPAISIIRQSGLSIQARAKCTGRIR